MRYLDCQPIFYSIESSAVKKFVLFDIIIGTGLYYVCKTTFASEMAGIIGSIAGTEGIKRFPNKILTR